MENQSQEAQTKKCKYCKESIAKEANVCRFCRKKQYLSLGQVFIIIIIGMITLPIVMTIISSNTSPSPSSTTQLSTDLRVGDTGTIKSSSGSLLVALTRSDAKEVISLSVAKDTLGVSKMVLDGRVMLVDSGTKIRVIDTDLFYTNVRILEGKYYGESGWLPNEFVSK